MSSVSANPLPTPYAPPSGHEIPGAASPAPTFFPALGTNVAHCIGARLRSVAVSGIFQRESFGGVIDEFTKWVLPLAIDYRTETSSGGRLFSLTFTRELSAWVFPYTLSATARIAYSPNQGHFLSWMSRLLGVQRARAIRTLPKNVWSLQYSVRFCRLRLCEIELSDSLSSLTSVLSAASTAPSRIVLAGNRFAHCSVT
jgi:hypothetical protein